MTTVGLILTVIGLTIAKPLPNSKYGNQSMVTNVSPGTSVHLAVEAEKGMMIISMDEKASKVTSYKDDKGTDLLTAGRKFGKPAWLGTWVKVSDDKKRLTFTVRSEKLPAKGATSVSIKGKAVVNCAKGTKAVATKEMPISVKQPVVCGPIKASISKLGTSWDQKMEITLKSSKNFDAIKKISMITPEGKTIEGKRTGSGSSGFAGKYTYTISYGFKMDKLPARAKLKFKVFDGMEKKEIPINVTTSIGL